jgi:DNA-directed RNA polymerase I, II, and III subunit RPABC2
MSKRREEDEDEIEISEEENSDSDDDTPHFERVVKKPASKPGTSAVAVPDGSDDDDDDSEDEDGSDKEKDDDSDIDSQADPEEEDEEEDVASSHQTGLPRLGAVSSRFSEEYDDEDDEEEDEEDDHYLQKFDETLKTNIIEQYHPELLARNYDEVDILTRVVRNEAGVIIDPLHKTLPFLTKYEKARILGERAKQIDAGAKPFVEVDPSIIDGYLIALAEFEQKKIPFIVKRPLPNGGCEYWKMRDLEILSH